jgi:YesN/AraC family two-component response regulator
MYQGLHGIKDLCVMEVSDHETEAREAIEDWGNEASTELIYSYGLEDEYYAEACQEDEDELDISESYYFQCRNWFAYKIRKDVTLSEDELNKECYCLGEELFIEEYCEKEVFV